MWNPFKRRSKAPQEQERNRTDEPRDNRGRFKPGHSGNPGGRPKGTSITAALRELIDEAGPDSVAGPLLEAAQAGDIKAIKVVLERTEGRVTEQLEHAGQITVRVEYADDLDPAAPAASGPADGPPGVGQVQCAGDGPALGQDDLRSQPPL